MQAQKKIEIKIKTQENLDPNKKKNLQTQIRIIASDNK